MLFLDNFCLSILESDFSAGFGGSNGLEGCREKKVAQLLSLSSLRQKIHILISLQQPKWSKALVVFLT